MHPSRKHVKPILLPLLLLLLPLMIPRSTRASTHCEQKWDDIKAPHIVADYYHVHLLKINTTEEYRSFMPNTKYQVTVTSDEGDVKFTRFYMTVENENHLLSNGHLELYDSEVSKFSQDCPDSVVQTSQVLKDEVLIYWISPEEGSGCVVFRVSIMESPSRWFMDGSLEQRYCQDPKANVDDPGPVLPECCACDEAKYELAFEGLWSRYTHPKDFPSKPWSARFSDVIGASHTTEYRFWEYDGAASEGLKQVAETGITQILEAELKNQSQHIRTIIKARGINFPNITSKTFAMFRVDQQHHLVSLVSMITPSPDWFLGISGLELCLINCSWIESKELNLYPIDAGTDDGVTYEALDAKTEPQDVIRRITTTWPADERSPFYDVTAIDMNPMAKLYLKRQRVYEKECEGVTDAEPEEACRVTKWGDWGPCSVTCGKGFRRRERRYKNQKSAVKHQCDTDLTDTAPCLGSGGHQCPEPEFDTEKCPLTEWSGWSACTKPCGHETRARERTFRGKRRRKHCAKVYPGIELQESKDCDNPECVVDEDNAENEGDETTPETSEGYVSESNTVSDDLKEEAATTEVVASMLLIDDDDGGDDRGDDDDGDDDLVEAEGNGSQASVVQLEPSSSYRRRTKKCVSERYTPWSMWSPCSVTCGLGTKSRSRQLRPGYDESAIDHDKDLSIYECQYESTTCVADPISCDVSKDQIEVICSQPLQPGRCPDGHSDNSLRYYYDKTGGKCDIFHYAGCQGNMNNFRTQQECQDTCSSLMDYAHYRKYKLLLSSIVAYNVPYSVDRRNTKTKRPKCDENNNGEESSTDSSERKKKKKKHRKETKSNEEKIHCRFTEWSGWSTCLGCKGYRTMTRDILIYPRNGGKSCPTKLIRRQKCHKVLPECDAKKSLESSNHQRNRDDNPPATENEEECRVTEWGPWTSCSSSCGSAQRWRVRYVAETGIRGQHSKSCPPLTDIKECKLPPC